MSLQTYGKVQGFLFPFQMLCFLWQRIFFSVLTLKPSPIILLWHPSKDPDQRAKQDNKAKKPGARRFGLGAGLLKHCNSFSKGIFHFVSCSAVGEQLVSRGYKLRFGCLEYTLFRAPKWVSFCPCLWDARESLACLSRVCNMIVTRGKCDPKDMVCKLSHNLARSKKLVNNTTAAGLDMRPPELTPQGSAVARWPCPPVWS